MDKKWFKGKTVTVFGIGLLGGGVGTIKFLAEQGAHVIATDIKKKEHLAASLEQLEGLKNITYVLGQHRREDFERVDMVIKTPGCPWTNEHVQIALKNDIPVETDASLFFQLCPVPIVGVTGTKGKTTTTKFIYHLLKKGDRTPVLFGVEKLAILDRLSYVKKNTIVVFELSSWRLSALRFCQKSPHIAVFTNFFPDHLNYYKSMDEYFADKAEIYKHQKARDVLIYNAEEERLVDAARTAPGRTVHVGASRRTDGWGMFVDGGVIYRNDGIDVRPLIPVEKLHVHGTHNHINVMLAMSAAFAAGVSEEGVLTALSDLPGIPHRLEFVRELRGVTYYNDTAASNPQAAVIGVRSFERPVVLIAGGSDKGLPLGELPTVLAQEVKDVVFLAGASTDKMIAKMRALLPPEEKERTLDIAESMEEAIALTSEKAVAGDAVVLSPGAASFGMFKNEFDRGDQFRAIVKDLS